MKKILMISLLMLTVIFLNACDEIENLDNNDNSQIDDNDNSQIDDNDNDLDDTLTFSLITVNDLHGHVEQDEYGQGGISNTAYLIDEQRDEVDTSVLLANGDMFQGTAISNMTEGEAVVNMMNMMHFDAMGIGNHEFDWGIETILKYFDQDITNGEANFPLLNANIYHHDNTLLTVDEGNVFESYIVEKDDISVGILSYVGDIYTSIAYTEVQDYYFDLDIAQSVETLSLDLKTQGADIIVVNIHGGNTGSIEDYNYNTQISTLKDSQGDYLVDVVVNGHTHRKQTGMIFRDQGTPLMLVQAGGNNEAIGVVDFTFDTSDMSITNYDVDLIDVDEANSNYDKQIETYIQDVNDGLGTVNLTLSGETITNRYIMSDWIANVMLAATDADIAISNFGGIRSTANITKDEYVTLAQMYEVFPFDNTIWIVEASYDEFSFLLNNSSLHYTTKNNMSLNENETYKVAINSYVYYWDTLDNLRSLDDIDTALYMRDLLIDDLELKGELNILFNPSVDSSATITSYVNPNE